MNVVPLKDLKPEEPELLTLDVLKNMDPADSTNDKSRGQLVVEVTYSPFKEEDMAKDFFDDSNVVEKAPENTPEGGGLLVVIVHEAQDVEGKHHTNPYVRILFRGEQRKTKVLMICLVVSLVPMNLNSRIGTFQLRRSCVLWCIWMYLNHKWFAYGFTHSPQQYGAWLL